MYKKIDDNQKSIVSALRKIGCNVLSLASIGKGCPDLLVKFRGKLCLIEIKDGSKPPSQRKLTPDQEKFHAEWSDAVHIVISEEEAIKTVMALGDKEYTRFKASP